MAGKILAGAHLALLCALLLLTAHADAHDALQKHPLLPASSGGSSDPAEGEVVHLVRLNGVIDPIVAQYLTRAVDRAERENAVAVVVLLDTPGGLDSAMRAMTQRLLAASVPVVVYVAPAGARAASAGVFITIAAHIAAMAPGTNIGAAHPVALGGGQLDSASAEKIANDAASTARALASERGRNAGWADRAVRESISATDAEALAEGVIDLVARDLDDLLNQLDGRSVQTSTGPRLLATRGARPVAVDMTLMELVLHTLLNPNIAFILINLGLLGLLAEFFHPGTLVPGIAGVIAILLALVALGTLPVNWGGALLLLLALALFVADVYASAHGVLSIGGVVAFVLGGLLLFSPLDAMPWRPGPLAVSPWVVGAFAALFLAYFLVVVRASRGTGRIAVPMNAGPGEGRIGIATTDLDPSGVVRLDGEDWSALTVSGLIRANEAVEVVGRAGLHLQVRRPARVPGDGEAPTGSRPDEGRL